MINIYNNMADWCEGMEAKKVEGTHLLFVAHDKTIVGYGYDQDVDLDYCEAHGIPTYNQYRDGGTIVHAKGSITIALIFDNREYREFVLSNMVADLREHLANKGLNVSYDENDVLVDGYKTASGVGFNFGEGYARTYEGIQIAVYCDVELIERICKKPMVKIPKSLSEYGITTEDMYAWCKTWLENRLNISIDSEEIENA